MEAKEKREIFTILLSIFALIGTLLSLYFQFFYSNHSLVYNVRDLTLEVKDNKPFGTIKLSMVNLGNQNQYLESFELICFIRLKSANAHPAMFGDLKRKSIIINKEIYVPIAQHKFSNQVTLIKPDEKVLVSMIEDNIDFNEYFRLDDYVDLSTLPKIDFSQSLAFDETKFLETISRCHFAIKLGFLNSEATTSFYFSLLKNKVTYRYPELLLFFKSVIYYFEGNHGPKKIHIN